MNIAIIGAGIAGLAAAQNLPADYRVTLFDKARGPGGRLASRRREGSTIDHGTAGFAITEPHLLAEALRWQEQGVVATWQPRYRGHSGPEQLWLGMPRMSALTRFLASGLQLQAQTRITAISGEPGNWLLSDEQGLVHRPQGAAGFDLVLIALPAPQAADLLATIAHPAAMIPHWLQRAQQAQPLPEWVCLIESEREPLCQWDIALPVNQAVRQVVRNHAKPGRAAAPISWVVAMSHGWSKEHLELAPDEVIPLIDQCLRQAIPEAEFLVPSWQQAHRWRFGQINVAAAPGISTPLDAGLAVAGDWLHDGTVQGAWLSGMTVAKLITATAAV